jgi:hypothetical protein
MNPRLKPPEDPRCNLEICFLSELMPRQRSRHCQVAACAKYIPTRSKACRIAGDENCVAMLFKFVDLL